MSYKKKNTQTARKGGNKSLAEKENIKERGSQQTDYKNPLLTVTLKFLIFVAIIFSGLYFSDSKGYFNSQESLDYISKGWDAFDQFTEENNVDIILLGNSHMFANINPKNLSMSLGANAFAIGGPGSAQHDLYFCLKEALKKCKPSLVVLETFSINDSPLHQTLPDLLTHQLNSFTGRNDIMIKIISTPILFTPDQYGYAWSKTIRNHNYIFSNKKQLEANKELIKERKIKKKKNQELYLGQLIYYTKGMEDSTIKKFNTIEAPVDGEKYTYNKYEEKYTDKIVELCEKNDIEILFFTNPMYPKNIKDYNLWKSKLSELLNKYNKKWYDLQYSFSEEDFPPICFQNTYKHKNQHLTHLGALVSAYKLADFIQVNYSSILPNRKKDIEWHKIFYGQDGYFENYSPVKQDVNNKAISINLKTENDFLNEVIISKQINTKGEEYAKIIAKIDRKLMKDPNNTDVKLSLRYIENGTEKIADVFLNYDNFHKPAENIIFVQNLKSINVVSVIDYGFIKKQ